MNNITQNTVTKFKNKINLILANLINYFPNLLVKIYYNFISYSVYLLLSYQRKVLIKSFLIKNGNIYEPLNTYLNHLYLSMPKSSELKNQKVYIFCAIKNLLFQF